jgi:hypothetical protein
MPASQSTYLLHVRSPPSPRPSSLLPGAVIEGPAWQVQPQHAADVMQLKCGRVNNMTGHVSLLDCSNHTVHAMNGGSGMFAGARQFKHQKQQRPVVSWVSTRLQGEPCRSCF